MSGNGRVRPSKPPRARLVATGEDVPKGHSIRANLLIVDVALGDVELRVLTECLRYADPNREMVQVRRTFEGCPRQVLHLKTKDMT